MSSYQARQSTSAALVEAHGPRESMAYDVVVVGGGPAGLSTAIRLKQLAAEKGTELDVVVIEKGSEPGAHILSGAIMDPRALTELLPDWQAMGAPLNQPVSGDDVLFLTETGAKRTPDALVPGCFHNDGCYVVSLGAVTKWLGAQAEALGVEIFPGFTAANVVYDDAGAVAGGAKHHAPVVDRVDVAPAVHLEAAGIGEHRPVPTHESVQATGIRHDLLAGLGDQTRRLKAEAVAHEHLHDARLFRGCGLGFRGWSRLGQKAG